MIRKADLRQSFRRVESEVRDLSPGEGSVVGAIAGVAVLFAGLTYVVGQRRGRKCRTYVEVYSR